MVISDGVNEPANTPSQVNIGHIHRDQQEQTLTAHQRIRRSKLQELLELEDLQGTSMQSFTSKDLWGRKGRLHSGRGSPPLTWSTLFHYTLTW